MSLFKKLFRWSKKPFHEIRPEPDKKSPVRQGVAPVSGERLPKEAPGTGAYAQVLLYPYTSEKSENLGKQQQYVFAVDPEANKPTLTAAFYDLYKVKPQRINLVKIAGKSVRFGKSRGQTKSWKKAIITLPSGQTIKDASQ